MSVPALLEALASRVLGSTNGSFVTETAHLRLKQRFVERVVTGNGSHSSGATSFHAEVDPIVALEGMALGWNLSCRFDHATALNLLLERIPSCNSIPNGMFYHISGRHPETVASNSEIRFTEGFSALEFLYRLYILKHLRIGSTSRDFNPQTHRLTPYAELLLKQQDSGANGARKEVGWYFASGASLSSSASRNSNQTELSVNDTTVDALWSALLSPHSSGERSTNPTLKHPVFSVPLRHELTSSLKEVPSYPSNPFNPHDPTHIHRVEGFGSMFGMLRFAHPSVVPRLFGSGSDSGSGSQIFPKMRLDINGDKEHRLELPELNSSEETPPWIQMQKWKPQSILETLSPSSSDRQKPKEGIHFSMLPIVESKKVTVAEWLERTWHGASGPQAPWKAPIDDVGVAIEEEVLEWKDRLVYRARLLNVVSETIGEALQSYLISIKTLFPDSYLTATAFCNAVRRFINFWRGELLFTVQKPPNKSESIDSFLGPHLLDDVLPPPSSLTPLSLCNRDSQEEHQQYPSNSDSEDFMKSFFRIVSTTGSCTQITHLYHTVGQLLGVADSESQYPVGVDPINKLTQICIHTEMDPIVTFGISRQLLSQTMVPFGRFFSEWLFWGALPPHAEFMIAESAPLAPSSFSATLSTSAHPNQMPELRSANQSHWLEAFSVRIAQVPSFLHQYADVVLKTGALVRIHRDMLAKVQTIPHWDENRRSNESTQPLPLLRPVWSLSQLQKYHESIESYIGGVNASEEVWDDLEWLKENEGAQIVSVEQSLYESFVVPLQLQFNRVSPAVCRGLVDDWALLSVFERLKSDYFGNLVSAAFDALPLGVDLLDESAASHSLDRLRLVFLENIQGTLKRLGYRLALEKVPLSSGIDVLDNIFIEPSYIEWPLSILITPHHLEQYNAVFVLLTKMTRTRAALNTIWTNLSAATRLAHRLRLASQKPKADTLLGESIFEIDWASTFQVLHKASLFCHQLQHFWTQLFNFIANQVGNTCFFQLQQSISSAVHFETLVDAHQQFMASVMRSSLLAPNLRALMVVVEKTIHVVHKFRQQIRHSLADPSKWEMRMRKAPMATKATDLDATLGFTVSFSQASSLPSGAGSPASLNESIFEQADYQPDQLDELIQTTRKEFEKCMKFLMAVLLKLVSRGCEPHIASLVASLNWNKFYFSGSEAVIGENSQ